MFARESLGKRLAFARESLGKRLAFAHNTPKQISKIADSPSAGHIPRSPWLGQQSFHRYSPGAGGRRGWPARGSSQRLRLGVGRRGTGVAVSPWATELARPPSQGP